MATNGKTTTIIILVSALQAIVLFGMGILCTGVIENENRNTVAHAQMIKDRTEIFQQILQRLSTIEALIKSYGMDKYQSLRNQER